MVLGRSIDILASAPVRLSNRVRSFFNFLVSSSVATISATSTSTSTSTTSPSAYSPSFSPTSSSSQVSLSRTKSSVPHMFEMAP